jgi:mono/diheme cytochrome c family protein
MFSCGNKSSTTTESINSNSAFLARVKNTYGFKCAICHGKDGKPVIKTASDLRTTEMSHEEMVAIIKYGKGGTVMLPQVEVLDAEMIEGLAVYITTLGQ